MGQSSTAGAREAMRSKNQLDVLELIHRHGPIARNDIAARLRLSPATVTNITAELIEREVIFEARSTPGGAVGRRTIPLEVAYGRAAVAGIKLSNVGITCALTNLNAEVLATYDAPLPDTQIGTVIGSIARAVEELSPSGVSLGAPGGISAVGLSLPGVVDRDGSTVRHSPLLDWEGVPIGSLLSERIGVPVLVENDVNSLAVSETWFGYGTTHPSFLVVTLGRGLGLGIVVDGELYRGPSGGAGEFGHVLLDPHGPVTRHAKQGVLEAFLSDEALLTQARAAGVELTDEASPEELVGLARNGDAAAMAVYEAAGRTLGRALSILVNIFAPSLIVLGGEGMRAAEFLLPPARTSLAEASFGDLGSQVQLVLDAWGDDAWARGAAALAARRYLSEVALTRGGD